MAGGREGCSWFLTVFMTDWTFVQRSIGGVFVFSLPLLPLMELHDGQAGCILGSAVPAYGCTLFRTSSSCNRQPWEVFSRGIPSVHFAHISLPIIPYLMRSGADDCE
jgi:hypothetical protein